MGGGGHDSGFPHVDDHVWRFVHYTSVSDLDSGVFWIRDRIRNLNSEKI